MYTLWCLQNSCTKPSETVTPPSCLEDTFHKIFQALDKVAFGNVNMNLIMNDLYYKDDVQHNALVKQIVETLVTDLNCFGLRWEDEDDRNTVQLQLRARRNNNRR
ncbi:hypothetical protein RI054_41g149480 [Pseudoscourfieldia marina]